MFVFNDNEQDILFITIYYHSVPLIKFIFNKDNINCIKIFFKSCSQKNLTGIDLKRITRCKLALIFTSADYRQFLGLFGSEAARLYIDF